MILLSFVVRSWRFRAVLDHEKNIDNTSFWFSKQRKRIHVKSKMLWQKINNNTLNINEPVFVCDEYYNYLAGSLDRGQNLCSISSVRACSLSESLSLCVYCVHISVIHVRWVHTNHTQIFVASFLCLWLILFWILFFRTSRPVVPCHIQALCCHWSHFHIDFMNVPYSFIHKTQTLVSFSLTHIHTSYKLWNFAS